VQLSEFDYYLPPELIAQHPIEPRDQSRLLVVNRHLQTLEHRLFCNVIDYLEPGDTLVFNDTKVMPARLMGWKEASGAHDLIHLLHHSPSRGEPSRVRTGSNESLMSSSPPPTNPGFRGYPIDVALPARSLTRRSLLALVPIFGLASCSEWQASNDPYIPTMKRDPMFSWRPPGNLRREYSYSPSGSGA